MKDPILFAMNKKQADITKRVVPIELLNLKNVPEQHLDSVQEIINQLATLIAPYGYHLWISEEYIEENTDNEV